MADDMTYWMRCNAVRLQRYLPQFVAGSDDICGLLDGCNVEHDKIRLMLQDLFRQFFVETATWGLSRYEGVLGIQRNPSDDIYQRRARILLKLQSHQTSTIDYMTKLARQYFADIAAVNIVEDNESYAFKIVADRLSYDINGLMRAMETYKPAHLAYYIVHILLTSGNLSAAGVVQTVNTMLVNPICDIDITITPAKIYAFGNISKGRVYTLEMEGVR